MELTAMFFKLIAAFTSRSWRAPQAFPAGFGQKSREYQASQLDKALAAVQRADADIPAEYWQKPGIPETASFVKWTREARLQQMAEGSYDRRMLSLLKKVRCKHDPASFECALTDE